MYIQQAPTVQLSQWLQFPAAGPRRKSFEVVGSAVDVLWMVIVARQLDDIISTTTTTTTCGFNKVNGTCAIWSLACHWGQHRLARHNTRPWPGSGVCMGPGGFTLVTRSEGAGFCLGSRLCCEMDLPAKNRSIPFQLLSSSSVMDYKGRPVCRRLIKRWIREASDHGRPTPSLLSFSWLSDTRLIFF